MQDRGVRAKAILYSSLVLNVAMGIAWWGHSRASKQVRPASGAAALSPSLTNKSFRIAKTNIVFNARTLTWQDIESTNYERYVFNLRGMGCPETIVRDIILADVNQLYARKRQELITTNDLEWWKSEPNREELRLAAAKRQALEAERRRLLTRLLGPNWEQSAEIEAEPVALTGEVLAGLTPEQKQAVQEIVARSKRAARDYLRQCELFGEQPDSAELAQLREQTRQELAAKLNADQLQEFLLRHSDLAAQLREQLRGVNTTPEEFRKLFASTDPIDRQLQLLGNADDAASMTERQQLERQREAAIRQALSPENYDTYRFVTDAGYRAAVAEAEQAGAPARAGKALYEINQAAATEKERINANSSLTPEQREQELKQIEELQKAARAAALGLQPPPPAKTDAPQPNVVQHRTGPTDTLEGLSLFYRVPMSELMRANPGLEGGAIPPGQVLKIPAPPPLNYTPGFVPQR